jgi:2-polyprenyl-6-methoxyphenol hydroxylase-like FAD-dependent oxidoreductase
MDASSQPSSVCNALEEFFHTEFRVIIVGGGITGLTLANCLQQEGVDYVLLEARNDIAPQIGASVCLGPSALRIMDQLGLCDQIMEECEPVHTQYHWMGGKCSASDDFYLLSKARWGYDVCCLDRQILLRILYDGITDKTKIQTGKKVVTVDHKADRAMVHCENGSAFYGDVVVGADGVHSRVRKEMWRSANMSGSGFEPSIINYEETNRS